MLDYSAAGTIVPINYVCKDLDEAKTIEVLGIELKAQINLADFIGFDQFKKSQSEETVKAKVKELVVNLRRKELDCAIDSNTLLFNLKTK